VGLVLMGSWQTLDNHPMKSGSYAHGFNANPR
jgi:hypothetical protein